MRAWTEQFRSWPSRPAGAVVPRRSEGRRLTALRAVALTAIACVGLLALGAGLAGARSASEVEARLRKIAEKHSEGKPNPLVEAEGIDPGAATLAFVTPYGVRVRVVSAGGVTCVMLSDGQELCATQAQVLAGESLGILNECGPTGKVAMTMYGVGPARATRVKVRYTRGPGLSAGVRHGAFVIEAPNPKPRGPYPTGIAFMDAHGRVMAHSKIDGGNDLCLWKETKRPKS